MTTRAPEGVERLCRWPEVTEAARFMAVCSCGRWSATGTAAEIADAGRKHDDSPWRSHVVSIWGRILEEGEITSG